jgi:hypothetical protein
VRQAGCLRRAIHQQNPSKPDGWGLPPLASPASVSVTERVTEPMVEAPVEHGPHQTGSGWDDRKVGGAPIRADETRIRDVRITARQVLAQPAVAKARNPHGVESAPTTDEGSLSEPGNLAMISSTSKSKMIEMTDECHRGGRSLRSSPRTGKLSTWQRETVSTASRQEVGT